MCIRDRTGTGEFWINSKFDSITKRVCTRKVKNRFMRALADISKGANNQCLLTHNRFSYRSKMEIRYLITCFVKKLQPEKKLVKIVTNI